jgi:tetratricopeptide (TPR) repeat protein
MIGPPPRAGRRRAALWLAAALTTGTVTATAPGPYELGRAALRQGDFTAAVAHLECAVAERPREADVHVWLGNAYAWMAARVPTPEKPRWGRLCLAAYRRALALDPDHVDAHFSLMNYYRHVPAFFGGGLAKAWAQAGEVARRDAARGAQARALLLEQEGREDEALQVLRAAVPAHPDNFALNFMLGRLAVGSGRNLAEGEAALRRCLELEPTGSRDGRAEVQALLQRLPQLHAKH